MGQTEETRAMMGNHFRLEEDSYQWAGRCLTVMANRTNTIPVCGNTSNHSAFGDPIERQITKLADSQI